MLQLHLAKRVQEKDDTLMFLLLVGSVEMITHPTSCAATPVEDRGAQGVWWR
jgi:hypothetical protein